MAIHHNITYTKETPVFSKRAFWDVDIDAIDYESNSGFVIVRIIERGKYTDLISLFNFYGKERIMEVLLHQDHLPEIVLYFATTIFNQKPNKFRCFKKK